MGAPGEMIDGRFELIERLGSGGMGTVWRARDTALDREVALKEVRHVDPAFIERNTVLRERALREARALARISHPHVVTIHQILEPGGHVHPWIVMELLPGRTLQDRLAAGPLPPAETARIGREVLSALRAAHAAGIQHRDVKPANVMLREDGSAVLTDFGIAALQGSTSLTQTGEMVGSPEFMAPERIRGTDGDPASDLWSLGIVLYVAAEGVSPLRRATPLATLAAVLDEPVPPLRSGPLTPVLETLLVRDPAARPDAARLDAMLAEIEAGRSPHVPQARTQAVGSPPLPGTRTDSPRPVAPTAVAPAPRRRPRRRTPVIAAAVAVAVAATALVVTLRGNSGDQNKDRGAGTTQPPARGDSTAPPTSAAPSPGADPIPASGRWVAMLYSEPTSSGEATRDARLATLQQDVPDTKYVLSDDYASLRPGFWVYYAGPFPDGNAALSYCAERDLVDKNQCVGRYISTYPADLDLLCYPPATAPTGTCRRD
ncbi:serine/threonine protein kinase [Streptomyces sp. TRM66268-LWL]|uniref:non-specific serine/threonine protein kinase n=1 Tax=Streptomyces polyasparticus TaxID=2767826 RepID=A0ABR7SAL1_9ACTN|nr:serine/threonine-protein kinase [Streptomyces polyasparticus]MBC9712189.1 serine/threonine protein kinase [Streptomyces polyasparticus]